LLSLTPLFREQRGRRDAEIGRRALGETFVPLAAIHLAFESGQRHVTDRPMVLLRIAPKALVERLR
jgi:hypothetical protein